MRTGDSGTLVRVGDCMTMRARDVIHSMADLKGRGPDIEHDAPVLGVIRLLLAPLLPTRRAGSLNDLARRVAQHPEIAIHSAKVWGDLPESARTAVKREVQIVARSVGGGG